MNLSNIRAPKKASEKRKRVGRGMGSGMGKTSTRGHKGQRSRSGSRMMRGFEGGQMPLHRRLPKVGFTNIFRKEYTVVNIDQLAALGESTITPDVLRKSGVIKSKHPVKILGDGDLSKKLTVRVHAISGSAREKIEAAGGTVELLREPKVKKVRHRKAKPVTTGEETAAAEEPVAEESAAEEPAEAEE